MLIKTFLGGLLLAAAASPAIAYTGPRPLPLPPERCIVGQSCVEACLTDADGAERCQVYCTFEVGACGPEEGGVDECEEPGDEDNAPDLCDDERQTP